MIFLCTGRPGTLLSRYPAYRLGTAPAPRKCEFLMASEALGLGLSSAKTAAACGMATSSCSILMCGTPVVHGGQVSNPQGEP